MKTDLVRSYDRSVEEIDGSPSARRPNELALRAILLHLFKIMKTWMFRTVGYSYLTGRSGFVMHVFFNIQTTFKRSSVIGITQQIEHVSIIR
jgi:hypothetical protein